MKYEVKDGKIVNDNGDVAVAYSPSYGVGWSTWTDIDPIDPEFNILFLEGKIDEAKKLAEERKIFNGGINGIMIKWIPEGERFLIDEFNGAETIRYEEDLPLYTA